MKFPFTLVATLFFAPFAAFGQTITLDSVSAPKTCDTAQVTVYYTASGSFGVKNVFTVQASFDNSFTTFLNAGEIKSTTSGSISITVSHTPVWIRVASSNPYITTGSRMVSIPQRPEGYFTVSKSYALTGDNVFFQAPLSDSAHSYDWNFGDGATPETSTDSAVNVSYSTTGTKTVSLTVSNGMCASAGSATVHVFTCNPSIPSDARIDSTNGISLKDTAGWSRSIWVVPGGSLDLSDLYETTIFAEPGSTVGGTGIFNVVYLKAGAVFTGQEDSVIIYEPGASVGAIGDHLLECSSLAFDYTNAPTYKITWAGVTPNEQPSNIRIYPNPASHLVTVETPVVPNSIMVRNDLGDILLMDNGPIATSHLQFDVSRFAAGVYYVELGLGNRSVTSKFTISR